MTRPFDYSQEEWIVRVAEGRAILLQMKMIMGQLDILLDDYNADKFSEDVKDQHLRDAIGHLSLAIEEHERML